MLRRSKECSGRERGDESGASGVRGKRRGRVVWRAAILCHLRVHARAMCSNVFRKAQNIVISAVKTLLKHC